MPDIAMCRNILCPSKLSCYRFTAIPDTYQSYGGFTVPEGEDKCNYYVDDSVENQLWGSIFDENGNRLPEIKYTRLRDLELDHIKNIKRYFKGRLKSIRPDYLKYFNKRIKENI